jgi:hypothetical protein
MSMTTNTHNGRWSHRLGRGAGRAWRGYLRREQRVAGWLVTRGVPAGAATAVLWIVKLAVLGMLLYSRILAGPAAGLCGGRRMARAECR